MLVDTLVVFFLVLVWLVMTILVLWGITKLVGYVVMLFEGEPLMPEIRREVDTTRRQIRRHMPAHG